MSVDTWIKPVSGIRKCHSSNPGRDVTAAHFGPCSSCGASSFSVEHAAALQHLFPFTLEPCAPACKLTFLFQPSPVSLYSGLEGVAVCD